MINIVKDLFLWVLFLFGKLLVPIVFFMLVYIEYTFNIGVDKMIVYLLLLMLLGSLFYFIYIRHKERKFEAAYSKVKNALKGLDEFKEVEKIRLFSVTDIGQKYKPLEMIEVLEHSKENARHALQFKAKELGADAVINVVASITSDTKGKINADTLFTHGGGGSIETSNMYYYTGTAVKFV